MGVYVKIGHIPRQKNFGFCPVQQWDLGNLPRSGTGAIPVPTYSSGLCFSFQINPTHKELPKSGTEPTFKYCNHHTKKNSIGFLTFDAATLSLYYNAILRKNTRDHSQIVDSNVNKIMSSYVLEMINPK